MRGKLRCRFAVAPKLAQLRAGAIPESWCAALGLRPAENADLTRPTFQNRARKLNLKGPLRLSRWGRGTCY